MRSRGRGRERVRGRGRSRGRARCRAKGKGTGTGRVRVRVGGARLGLVAAQLALKEEAHFCALALLGKLADRAAAHDLVDGQPRREPFEDLSLDGLPLDDDLLLAHELLVLVLVGDEVPLKLGEGAVAVVARVDLLRVRDWD